MENIELISVVVTICLSALSFYFGGRYQKAKLLAQISIAALDDDKITSDEARDIILAVRELLK